MTLIAPFLISIFMKRYYVTWMISFNNAVLEVIHVVNVVFLSNAFSRSTQTNFQWEQSNWRLGVLETTLSTYRYILLNLLSFYLQGHLEMACRSLWWEEIPWEDSQPVFILASWLYLIQVDEIVIISDIENCTWMGSWFSQKLIN